MMKIAGLLALTAGAAATKVRGTENNELSGRELTIDPFNQCMERVAADTMWPVPNSDPVDTGRIDSAFGPVHSLCLDQDIFHKGIAVYGHPDDPVVAPYDGKVVFVNDVCVVIEHNFANNEFCTFHDATVNKWYSLFMGMKEITLEHDTIVDMGDKIGEVGYHACEDGSHPRTTVEYQVRIGSRHSLHTAIKEEYSQSYDPSVNPMFAHADLGDPHVVESAVKTGTGDNDVLIEVRTMDDEPNVNRYEIECTGTGGAKVKVLDLSLKIGFEEQAADAISPFNTGVPYLDAQPFGNMRRHWRGHLIIPHAWLDDGDSCEVKVYDVWGDEQSTSFTYPLP